MLAMDMYEHACARETLEQPQVNAFLSNINWGSGGERQLIVLAALFRLARGSATGRAAQRDRDDRAL
jgi:hypothetical protein